MQRLEYIFRHAHGREGDQSIFLNHVRQKQSVYDVLLLCGLLIPYGHLQFAYACEIRVQIFCGVYAVDMFFFYLALF